MDYGVFVHALLKRFRLKSFYVEMKGASLLSIFILRICSVTYNEIFHASSIQLYLTFKTFLKNLQGAIFLDLKGAFFLLSWFPHYRIFSNLHRKWRILHTFKKAWKNIGHLVNFRDIFKKLTFEGYVLEGLVTMATNMTSKNVSKETLISLS